MKNQTGSKRLYLNKKTVAHLNPALLNAVRGGLTETFCIRTIDNTISTIDRSENACITKPDTKDACLTPPEKP